MKNQEFKDQYLLEDLKERAKELNCLYRVDDILSNDSLSLPEIFNKLIKIIPSGWQYPKACSVRIIYEDSSYQEPGFSASTISQSSNLNVDGKNVGRIEVYYSKDVNKEDKEYFLENEYKLIETIADRISKTILHKHMEEVLCGWNIEKEIKDKSKERNHEWMVIVDLLERTDQSMLLHTSRKMLNHLSSKGVKEAQKVLWDFSSKGPFTHSEVNYPTEKFLLDDISKISSKTFNIARKHLSDDEIFIKLTKWIQAEKAYSLIRTIDQIDTTVRDVIDAINRYSNVSGGNSMLHSPTEHWLVVALIRIFLSENLKFMARAKEHIEINDFYNIIDKIIFPKGSHGKIGGKATGLFVAQKIIQKASKEIPELASIKVPKTWYITTDEVKGFLNYNGLEELNMQKYKELFEVRNDYPNVIQIMKNSKFNDDTIKSLAMALDDFGETPLIVRSSSILEDQMGSSFSGKYKSLFLANQGSKEKRLEELMDAIIEVYASMYSPDSIQYRDKAGLLDFPEEMGIMIQEVVGNRVGNYFFPLFAGVAFSNNEFRWSPRLKREDGLLRMVVGLGTRAVDRVGDDFPFLLSPGQAGIEVNSTPEEVSRYSPKKLDVINLNESSFETIDINSLLKEYGSSILNIEKIVSILKDDYLQKANPFNIDFEKDDLPVTFNGLINDTSFVKTMDSLLKVLNEKLGTPVDIEFASDGKDIYLLQCRPQSFSEERSAPPIPKELPKEDTIFSAKRYISNGFISNISHIVYVDPKEYDQLKQYDDLLDVGKAVGLLNSLLPKQRFILMGPGRWGSRGEVKMGVQVSYSDINNTAALIEIAKNKSGYIPELSFGTHFFLDLVEANIRYLPLYPDGQGIIFNESFLKRSASILTKLLPKFSHLQKVIRVIDIPKKTDGKVLTLSMNADLEEALGYLSKPKKKGLEEEKNITEQKKSMGDRRSKSDDSFWRWRYYMAERIADTLDFSTLAIKGIYIFGSTNSGTAGPGSDIDLLIHFVGNKDQKEELMNILEGWSLSLAEINYMKTGYRCDGLLDVHLVSDEDIKNKSVFASKIGAITNPAQPLKVEYE
ncbi:PEP/pyruvate-binding domain-containing protein [Halonatronum saccharophilum]|uniref:PEP/pyruvate-binding domain-containing protein n=1 Tax=Halonatronum saccharophilum TaxID=150060 RepID=UPI00047F518B|nr:PEP/pyruvate-binding domain-containing protein [Halonatronum saccharophilum]